MKSDSHVILVVDREFGIKICEIARGVPVWIVATETNMPAVREQWSLRPDDTQFNGITSFNDDKNLTPDLLAESMIDDIDLHHPRMGTLEIIGCSRSVPLLAKMETLAFSIIQDEQGHLRFKRETEEVSWS